MIFLFSFQLAASQKFKQVRLSSSIYDTAMKSMQDVYYYIMVPKGFKYQKYGVDCEGFVLTYKDSSMIYMVDDATTNVTPNQANGPSKERKTAIDTLENSGRSNAGLYWKERILGGIGIVGYVAVEEANKEEYDRVLNTLRSRTPKKK